MPRPWMKVETVLTDHPKTRALAKIWGCHRYTVAGFLLALWAYCIEYQDDGDTSELPDELLDELAAPCHATVIGTVTPAREALQRVGFLDPDGQIHDWDDYAGALLDQRGRDRRRQAERRKLESAGAVSREDWAELVTLLGHRCVYCGRVRTRLGVDHVQPLSRGGRHEIGNVLPACRRCNTKKGARLPEEAGMTIVPELALLIKDTRFVPSKVGTIPSNPSPKGSNARVEKSRVEKSIQLQQQQPDYPTRCCIAVNGVLEQRLAGAYRTLTPGEHGDQAALWEAAGIPVDLAVEVLRARAWDFHATPLNRQPHTLRYFDAAVREAWAKRQAEGGPAGLLTDADRMRAAAAAEREREQAAR